MTTRNTTAWNTEPARPATINGVEVPVGTPFANAVAQVGRNLGLGTVRVKLNGREVAPNAAPATINAGDQVELQPYDKAGDEFTWAIGITDAGEDLNLDMSNARVLANEGEEAPANS